MKIWILLFLSVISFSGLCNNDIASQKNINPVIQVMECLRNIPDKEITNPDHLIAKELSLMTSVIENTTLELDINTNEQKEFRELYKVAYKHCPNSINTFKAGYKGIANK
ncbi:hypothetical protein [Shewanella sp. 10N.286.52.A9]|uniref:hypothetical protein n=1 Tax=Shewanella sp. 10N.286.52.A9 TaxID=3229711 RepID=UPI00354D378F